MAGAEFARNTSRWPLRVMVGCVLLLFSALMAVVLAVQGNRPPLVALMLLPFLSCGTVCLLVKKHIPLWCGWCVYLSMFLCEIDPLAQLLWPHYIVFFLALFLVFYTAWALRGIWAAPQRRGPIAFVWLFGALVCLTTRKLAFQFYGTFLSWLSHAEQKSWQGVGWVLFQLSSLLFLILAAVALSALFYFWGRLLSKRGRK